VSRTTLSGPYRPSRFALKLAATAVATFLDYLVGRLTNRLSLAVIVWAVVTLVASALLDYLREIWGFGQDGGYSGPYTGPWPRSSLAAWMRMVRRRHPHGLNWQSVLRATWVGALAGAAGYTITLSVVSVRYVAWHQSSQYWLGLDSPYNRPMTVFVANFQSSGTMFTFMLASFAIALLLRPALALPLGVIGVSVVNSLVLPLPSLSALGTQFTSQLANSFSIADSYMFRLPEQAVPLGILGAFAVGMILCGFISAALR
jgi:hypothetical protein